MLKYRLTDIIKPTNLYPLYNTVYIHIVFHRCKKSFLIIEMNVIALLYKKNTEKTILLYIIVTVSRGAYLGIDQNIKRKFVSSAHV